MSEQHLGRGDARDGMLVTGLDVLELGGGLVGVFERLLQVADREQPLGQATQDNALLEAVAELLGVGARP